MKMSSLHGLATSLLRIYFSNNTQKSDLYKKTIYDTFRSMGGIYIKFLQILTVSHKFMDGWSTSKDYEIFNKVEAEYIDIKRYLINQDKYSYIELNPFACGSFAQIYKATLVNGDVVAIKMLRPSIYNNLHKDLKKLKRMLKLISNFLPDSIIDYNEAYQEFARNCLLEIDYDNEIANMEYFFNYYRNHEFVIIPKIYKELCSRNIIVQEYISGVTLADLISESESTIDLPKKAFMLTGSDLWKQIIIVGGEALKTAMCAPFVYGDPHPGNIILLSNDRIALVDFGLVARKPTSQEAFYLWVKSYYEVLMGNLDYTGLLDSTCMCFCPDLTYALKKYFGDNNFITSVSNILNDEAKELIKRDKSVLRIVSNGHLLSLFLDFVKNTKAINLKLDMRNYQLLKAMQAFLGSVTTLDKKANDDMFSYLMRESMRYALDYVEKLGVVHDMPFTTKYSQNESYEIFMEFLTSIANRDEFLFNMIMERMML